MQESQDDAAAEKLCDVLTQEMKVAQQAAEKYPNNYNAWNYRLWLLDVDNCVELILKELRDSEVWVSLHVSDHSGFHYRQNLLTRLKTAEHKDYNQLMQNELLLCSDLITRYPGHEAIWSHR